jgi:hypothetical protein
VRRTTPPTSTHLNLPADSSAAATQHTAGTKTAVDGVKGVGETIANVGKKSGASFANPAVSVFAAAGFGSLLLLAL